MTTRFFDTYANGVDPMVELTEAEALARRRYVTREDGSPTVCRRFLEGRLTTIIYPGWDDPSVPLQHFRAMNPNVPAEIYSVASTDDAGPNWRIWYVEPEGVVSKIVHQYFDTGDRLVRMDERGADSELRSYAIYRYDEQDWLIDVTRYSPDGQVLSIQDA